jgi:hypothetical protein
MRNIKNILILFIALGILGCGKVLIKTKSGTTISFDTNPTSTAMADVPSCAAGMTLVPAGIGHASFCIDNASFGSTAFQYHSAATQTCASSGKQVCSMNEIHAACQAGNIAKTQKYWTSVVTSSNTGAGEALVYDATTCLSWGALTITSGSVYDYYCCSQ